MGVREIQTEKAMSDDTTGRGSRSANPSRA